MGLMPVELQTFLYTWIRGYKGRTLGDPGSRSSLALNNGYILFECSHPTLNAFILRGKVGLLEG